MKTCKCCSNQYNQKEVERIFGKLSMPALLGYCSATCYTKAIIKSK
jgi:hypothetical protein